MLRIFVCSIFISLMFSFRAKAAFMSLNVGYDQFATEQMESNNASFKGLSYQFEIGAQMKHTILTFYIKRSNLNAKVLHDDDEFSLNSSHLSYGFKSSFAIAKKNYLTLGYNISNIENDFSNLTNYNSEGIQRAYDLDEKQRTNGLLIGVGRNFYKKRGYSLFGEYNYIDHGNLDARSHVLLFGFRFKTKINI